MIKLNNIRLKVDADYDFGNTLIEDDYGTFGNEYREGAIEHTEGDRGSYKYFYPVNKEYGKEDYKLVMDYSKGYWNYLYIRADAEIALYKEGNNYGTIQTITSGGIGGLATGDNHDEDMAEIIDALKNEVDDLKDNLMELGISESEINAAISKLDYSKVTIKY